MAAKRKPIEKADVGSYGVEEGADPFYKVRVMELPPAKEAGKIIQGEDDPAGAASELVRMLRDEAKVI
jgi:electron transfer flavoprotein alpha/beta subunit